MEFCFKSFDEFEDYLYKKRLAYEELRDENRQLEMDRLKDSDRIAHLEHTIHKLRREKETQAITIHELREKVPKELKKSHC